MAIEVPRTTEPKGSSDFRNRRTNVLALIEDGCRGSGSIRFAGRDTSVVTMGELWAEATKTGEWLVRRGGTGCVVGGVLTSDLGSLATLIGTWRAGGTFVSLPPRSRGVDVAVYQTDIAKILEAANVRLVMAGADSVNSLGGWTLDEFAPADAARGTRSPTALPDAGGSLIQFSSGTTGAPTGIALSLEALGSNVMSILSHLEVGRGDRCVSWLPLSHDMGLIGMTLASLVAASPAISNASLTLIEPDAFLIAPGRWLRAMAEERATITASPTFGLLHALRRQTALPADSLSTVRAVIVGAEKIDPVVLREFESAYAPAGLNSTAFMPSYGLAEAALAVTMGPVAERWSSQHICTEDLSDGRWLETEPGSPGSVEIVANGSVLAGTEVRTKAAAGSVGPVEIRGTSMFTGYVGSSEPPRHDGWFTTEDLGVLDGNELYLAGRTSELIVIYGRNFYASDLESCARARLPSRSAGIAAVQIDDSGYSLVVEASRELPSNEIRTAGRALRGDAISTFGIGPNCVVVVRRGSLPRTSSGKLRRTEIRRALVEHLLEPLAIERFA